MSTDSLEMVKRRIASIDRGRAAREVRRVVTGHDGIDRMLGGGLPRAHVHEFYAPDEWAASAAGFALALARRAGGYVLWLREEAAERLTGRVHGAGLVEIGIDPDALILALLPDSAAVLRAAADVVRCPDLGVALIELWGDPRVLDLTASRRLVLATETSGVTALMLRVAETPSPSAAQTRWRVGPAPSVALEADAPGRPAWEIELLRQRGRPAGGRWHVEWDRDRAEIRDATLPGAVVPLPVDRPTRGATIS